MGKPEASRGKRPTYSPMATGYASNAPREEVAPPPSLVPEDACLVCKRKKAVSAGLCADCDRALSE